ncbi:MAG TPA: PglZ domain-containing protein [Acidimicrobiaceae bacterium]|nr:PglZ domain-containing protein [Acidimicrobiaceae bacterium]
MPNLDWTHTPPDYDGSCVTGIVPPLVTGRAGRLVPQDVCDAPAVVVLVVDGLGWRQLERHRSVAPVLAGADGAAVRPITTVAPSTTSAALTSITTGATPGEHGVVGHTVPTEAGLLNTLRWTVPPQAGTGGAGDTDARSLVAPERLQPVEPFLGSRAVVVNRAKYAGSGFTAAHLRGARFVPWTSHRRLVDTALERVRRGDRLVFAYYDTLDRTAHRYGLGRRYRAVLAAVDAQVARLRAELPAGVVLMVTADHGMVEVREPRIELAGPLRGLATHSSGEARFRWLHAAPGRAGELLAAVRRHDDVADVMTRAEVVAAGWLGPHLTSAAAARLGDVALVARAPVVFGAVAPARPPARPSARPPAGGARARPPAGGARARPPLIGHHGALTAEEMLVPLSVMRGARR